MVTVVAAPAILSAASLPADARAPGAATGANRPLVFRHRFDRYGY